MEIIRGKKALAEAIRGLRAQGKTIGLTPTMGALHDGHISLVKIAREHADAVVASIFVNPTQFAPGEDFAKYPRTEAEDLKKLEAAQVAIAYLPDVAEMYPEGAVSRVQVPGISSELEGAVRPGHFDGVATVVSKLFMQALPDVAVFGEKDYQQLCVIRRFTRDLDIPVRIIGAPILREPDGLAMSSRNRYLNEQERRVAASLYKVLNEAAAAIKSSSPSRGEVRRGAREDESLPASPHPNPPPTGEGIDAVLATATASLLSAGFAAVDYLELRDAETFANMTKLDRPARLLAAARIGTTRLLDNIGMEP